MNMFFCCKRRSRKKFWWFPGLHLVVDFPRKSAHYQCCKITPRSSLVIRILLRALLTFHNAVQSIQIPHETVLFVWNNDIQNENTMSIEILNELFLIIIRAVLVYNPLYVLIQIMCKASAFYTHITKNLGSVL